jgi:hypothetical protein
MHGISIGNGVNSKHFLRVVQISKSRCPLSEFVKKYLSPQYWDFFLHIHRFRTHIRLRVDIRHTTESTQPKAKFHHFLRKSAYDRVG